MGLSLRGQTSGAVDINAPAVAGDNTITLPGGNGSANQFYKNSDTAGIITHSSMTESSSGVISIGDIDINGTTRTITTGVGQTVGFSTDIEVQGSVSISSGNLVLASGSGIDFSATADGTGTVTSELLDDYEEGEFTPSIDFNGNAVGLTYDIPRKGLYTKIGKQVTCYTAVALQDKGSSTGIVRLTGLPFVATDLVPGSSIEGGGLAIYQGGLNGTVVGPLTLTVIENSQHCEILDLSTTTAGTSNNIDNSDVQNTFSIRIVITYTAAN